MNIELDTNAEPEMLEGFVVLEDPTPIVETSQAIVPSE